MVSAQTAHHIRNNRKQALKRHKQNRKEPFKDIFHRDHFPATIGMFGFIIAFSLFSLKIALFPFLSLPNQNNSRQVEQLLVDTTTITTCEGFSGIPCDDGFYCEYEGGSQIPPYADAQGVCRPVSSEEVVCRQAGGTWRTDLADSCSNLCSTGLECALVISSGCDCGTQACWDGTVCISDNECQTGVKSVYSNAICSNGDFRQAEVECYDGYTQSLYVLDRTIGNACFPRSIFDSLAEEVCENRGNQFCVFEPSVTIETPSRRESIKAGETVSIQWQFEGMSLDKESLFATKLYLIHLPAPSNLEPVVTSPMKLSIATDKPDLNTG